MVNASTELIVDDAHEVVLQEILYQGRLVTVLQHVSYA